MSSERNDNDQGAQEILYWGVALVGLVAIKQLWTERVRPWIESSWGDLRAGELVSLPVVGRIDQVDVIGIGVLAVILLGALGVAAHKVTRRRRARSAAGSRRLPPPGGRPG